MKASVVILTLTRPEAIKSTLNALSTQTVRADQYEVIVVDDGSAEEHRSAIKRFVVLLTGIDAAFIYPRVNTGKAKAANVQAGLSIGAGGVFSIDGGTSATINSLTQMIQAAAGSRVGIEYAPPRPGDVHDSLSDIRAARAAFDFTPTITLTDGLAEYMSWIRKGPVMIEQMERAT